MRSAASRSVAAADPTSGLRVEAREIASDRDSDVCAAADDAAQTVTNWSETTMQAIRWLVKGTSQVAGGFCESTRRLTMPARLKFLTATPGALVCFARTP